MAPPGYKQLTLRVRAKNPSVAGFLWTTQTQGAAYFAHAGYSHLKFVIPQSDQQWQTIKICFCHDAELTGFLVTCRVLRWETSELEIDAAWLRSVDAETALKELTAAIADARKDRADPSRLLRNRGALYSTVGRWEQALADFREVEETGSEKWPVFCQMLLLAQTGDQDGYRKYRREAFARFAKEKEHDVWTLTEQAVRAALLLPAESEELKPIAHLAGIGLKTDVRLRWRQLTYGLAEYRSGRFASAIEWLEKSRELPPETPAQHLEAQTLLLLAMAHHGLGQKDEAKKLFEQAAKIIDEKLPKADSGAIGEAWPDWIITQALRAEALSLLGLDALSEAIRQGPKDVKLLAERADVLIKLGRRGEALADLDKATELEPKNAALLHKAASLNRQHSQSLLQADKLEAAQAHSRRARLLYEQLLSVDPDNAQCRQSWRSSCWPRRSRGLCWSRPP